MLHNPILTIDTVIFHWNGESLCVLLEKRDKQPFEGVWALPGGFVHTNEDANLAAARDRILKAKVGFIAPYIEKVDSIGDATRDSRGWAVSIIYLGILDASNPNAKKASDHLKFVDVNDVIEGNHPLAFDHVEIVRLAFQRLVIRCGYSSIPLQFLPTEFTIRELLDIHAALMGSDPNKVSVTKRYVNTGMIMPVIDPETQLPKKISRPAGPKPTIYEHNQVKPVNFAGVMGSA